MMSTLIRTKEKKMTCLLLIETIYDRYILNASKESINMTLSCLFPLTFVTISFD